MNDANKAGNWFSLVRPWLSPFPALFPSDLGIGILQATERPPLTRGATGTLDLSTSPEMSGSRGGGDAVSLNWNHLPRVDEAETDSESVSTVLGAKNFSNS